jgi:predicted dehydrogenase
MNWGILSTANIANRRCNEIIKCKNNLHSISSRSKEKSLLFKKKNNIKNVSDNHDELISNKEIHNIFLPIPCNFRFKYVEKACYNKKNILCEKPVCNDLNEMKQISEIVKENNIMFLDATDFLYNPKLINFKKEICDFNNVYFKFYLEKDSSFINSNIRTNKNLEPLGCLGDIGWYAIRWGLFLFNDKVKDVIILEKVINNGVIFDIKVQIIFENNKIFVFDCSFAKKKTQEMIIKKDQDTIFKTNDIFKLSDTKYKDDVFQNARLIEFFNKNINNKKVVDENLEQLIKVYEIIEKIV